MLKIDCESEGFPTPGPVRNGFESLSVRWDDLLWAAITVGRPNLHFVFQNGASSLYEALFRISALRMTLEQTSPGASRLRRTATARSLDPSEKGAVNYFLGLTLCKLFAAKKLGAPWLLHLDVFRDQLAPSLLAGRSRPDLVGQTTSGQWVALESKGRVSPPSADAKDKAKKQAERLIAVNGAQVAYRIGAFAYFKDENLRFFWRDPQPDGKEPRNAIKLSFPKDDFWRTYYQPLVKLIGPDRIGAIERESVLDIREGDLQVRVQPAVGKLLSRERWEEAGTWCIEHKTELARSEVQQDGIAVVAGNTWAKRFSGEFD